MQHRHWRLILAFLCTTSLFTLLLAAVAFAAPAPQAEDPPAATGQEYIVQPGDWLSTISAKYLGSPAAYQAIVDATNAKAATDPRFTVITDPNRIQVGQRLWIPAQDPETDAELAPRTPVTATVPLTGTTEMTGAREMAGTRPLTGTRSLTETMAGDEMGASQPFTLGVRLDAPRAGAVVPPTFTVAMTAAGLTIEPAGEINEDAGHFHILVDTGFVAPGELIPFDASHLHFGQGQLTTTLALEPGEHILRLQFANGAHLALEGAQYRDTLTVTVASQPLPLPSVRFAAPVDGAIVSPTVTVEMTATGLTIEPAGEINEGAGHFHILVDTDFVAPGELIPFDASHLHFGQGQLTTTVELEPGEHTLRLQFANGAHLALEGAPFRDTITVTVRAE